MSAGSGQTSRLTRIGVWLSPASRGRARARMGLAGLCATVAAFAGMAALMAGTAAAAGPAFNPATPTVFIAQGSPTQLEQAVESNGQLVFQNVGPAVAGQYNALAYDTVDNYLYGVNQLNGDILQIDANGAVTDTGANATLPDGTEANAAAWDPADQEVYIGDSSPPGPLTPNLIVYNPATNTTSTLALSAPMPSSDLTYADGYLWGDPRRAQRRRRSSCGSTRRRAR